MKRKGFLTEGMKLSSQNSHIHLYDAKTIDQLDWPANEAGQYAKKILIPFVKNGINFYINNIHADIFVLKVDDLVFPVTIADTNYANSYVCTPYSHYFTFGKEYIGLLIGNRFLMQSVKSILNGLEKIMKFGKLNSVVYVNNWMFSTDLYPKEITSSQIESIVALLTERFPKHAILMRSLNPIANGTLQTILQNHKFNLIASRYVYLTNTENDYIFHTRILKSDMKLLRETQYEILDETQISKKDCEQLLSLYNTLYIAQHSSLQPQFNLKYIQLLFDQNLLRFKVVKQNGTIYGVAGYYERHGIMMCPFFGYDKSDPQHNIVYRLLNTELLLEAQKKKLLFHQSAGASVYKKIRRAEGCLESMAIYTAHLPYKQKLSWNMLRVFMNKIAPKYMQKY